jgi:hypothetical protein
MCSAPFIIRQHQVVQAQVVWRESKVSFLGSSRWARTSRSALFRLILATDAWRAGAGGLIRTFIQSWSCTSGCIFWMQSFMQQLFRCLWCCTLFCLAPARMNCFTCELMNYCLLRSLADRILKARVTRQRKSGWLPSRHSEYAPSCCDGRTLDLLKMDDYPG